MTTLPEDEEFTRLIDAQFDRVDLVKTGANGAPRFLVAKQDGNSASLLEPGFVRGLIAKAEPEPAREDSVTMTGSPAAIAKLIHEAGQRKPDDVAKAEMSSKSINDLPDSAFGYIEPGGKKDASGKTTPRSKRHFPIHDKAHADNAAARIAQGAEFGKEAAPKVHAAQKKFGSKVSKEAGDDVAAAAVTKAGPGDMLDAQMDDGVDGLDPTVPLAAPEDDAPGDPTDPGSPAWEAIDAATAQKWCSILSRAQVALELLSEREMLEAASADPDDAENAWDLQDAVCAIDYVISVLAPYAVAEQSEADCCGEDMLAAVGKAMAGAEEPLSAVEAYAAVMKAGRVLSSANESLIRTAGESLQKVLASLPQAPIADDTVTKETAVAADQTNTAGEAQDVAKETDGGLAAGLKAGTTAVTAEAEQVAKDAAAGAQEGVAKADDGEKPKMVIVYDAKGNVVGIVDPGDITAVQGAAAPASTDAEPTPKPAAEPDAETAPPADPADLTPAPAADTGTPADDVAKEQAGPVAKSGEEEDPQAVLKSIVTDAMSALLDERERPQEVSKADLSAALEEIRVLKERLETVENTPAMPKVFTSGATPPPGTLRGQDVGAVPVDVAKARERKAELYAASGPDQARIAKEMQADAIGVYEAIRAAR